MKNIPVTYYIDAYLQTPERIRRTMLKDFADNGAKYIVLGADMLMSIMETPAAASVLQKELTAAGLELMDAHGLFMGDVDLCYPGERFSRVHLLRHLTALNITAELGVDTFTMHCGGEHRFPGYSMAELTDHIKRKLDVLLPEAEKLGIVFCLENGMPGLCAPSKLLELKACYPTDNLGFCYDSGHANIMARGREIANSVPKRNCAHSGFEPAWEEHALEKMLPHIVNCHLDDNHGGEDIHLAPGRGNIDWKQTMELLLTAPRLQVIQAEINFPHADLSVRELCTIFNTLLDGRN